MDFIEHLLISEGLTAILIVVDRFTKQSIFIPTYNTITSAQLAELFVVHVFSKHSVPSHVMSDRGDELARALLPTTSYFAISSILVGYFKLPISRQFIRLSLHKATIGT